MAPPLLWFLAGALLLGLALSGIDSDGLLLVGGLASLLLTLVTIALALPAPLQVLLYAGLVSVGYVLLRRWDRRQPERSLPPTDSSDRAEVIAPFNADGRGRVLWQGQSWAALNLIPETPLQAGQEVTVMGRQGTRLQVLPRLAASPSEILRGRP